MAVSLPETFDAVGQRYRPDAAARNHRCSRGERYELKRDSTNEHDSHAVKVLWHPGDDREPIHIAWVENRSTHAADAVAWRMDRGHYLEIFYLGTSSSGRSIKFGVKDITAELQNATDADAY